MFSIFSATLQKWPPRVLMSPPWISIAKNFAKFNKAHDVYLVSQIKLQIIYAFKKNNLL